MTVRIVFRGLLLFHERTDHMEIGVLDGLPRPAAAPHPHHQGPAHIPRIIKTKNGVINQIFDLRTRSQLRPHGEPGHVRDWEIEVTHPLQDGVTTYQRGREFDRLDHSSTRDFRWLTDLEGRDLHNGDLRNDINTAQRLLMVLRIRHGEFYTFQLSKPLMRESVRPAGPPVEYGMAAEVIGCDIERDRGDVVMTVANNVAYRFTETVEDGVVYEFSNAPPDVLPTGAYQASEPGHFSMYYRHLFINPTPPTEFNLVPEQQIAPAPDPAVCGAAGLGDRDPGNGI